MKRICVFCGHATGDDPVFGDAAAATGRHFAANGIRLIYGGGNAGLMGRLANAVLDAGGEVTGVIPDFLMEKELGHTGLTEIRLVKTMHERKAIMADLSDAFIALPGGFGTLDELCEILTWAQLGLHSKPCGVLNVRGFYEPFLAHIAAAVAHGFMQPDHRSLILEAPTIEGLMPKLRAFRPVNMAKWLVKEVR
jgi:uncharacterized protein (TIGR00730 family)